MRRIRRAAVLGTAALALATSGAATAAAALAPVRAPAPGCQPWNRIQPSFESISAVAMTSCGAWAVGSTADQTALVEHWNGPVWTPQAIPVEQGEESLSGVAATSPRNAWAVGYFSAPDRASATFRTLILRWDGSAWIQVPSPQGNPSHANELTAVAATSARTAWAVGTYFNGAARQTLILHWNGHTWKRQPSPDPAGPARFNTLTAVAATSATDAWAVGSAHVVPEAGLSSRRAFMLHWNGRHWTRVSDGLDPSDAVILTSVADTSARDAWAVGYEELLGQITHTVILHWNGHAWKRQHSPNRPGAQPGHPEDVLYGVTATSARNAWAVGYFRNRSNGWSTLILRWNGRAWRWVSSPNVPATQFNWLTAVAASSARNAWAVGDGPLHGIVMHWNGTTWQL